MLLKSNNHASASAAPLNTPTTTANDRYQRERICLSITHAPTGHSAGTPLVTIAGAGARAHGSSTQIKRPQSAPRGTLQPICAARTPSSKANRSKRELERLNHGRSQLLATGLRCVNRIGDFVFSRSEPSMSEFFNLNSANQKFKLEAQKDRAARRVCSCSLQAFNAPIPYSRCRLQSFHSKARNARHSGCVRTEAPSQQAHARARLHGSNRRFARGAHAPFVKQLDKRSRIDAHKRHVQRARQYRGAVPFTQVSAISARMRCSTHRAAPQCARRRLPFLADFTRCSRHGNDASNVFGAAAHRAFFDGRHP